MRHFQDGKLIVSLAILLSACAASGEDETSAGVSGAGNATGSSGSGPGNAGSTSLSGGSSSGGASGSGTGNAGSSTGGECGSEEVPSNVTTVLVPGNVLVVFDKSNSMKEDYDTPTGVKPKYVAAGEALLSAITPLGDDLTIGAVLFPSSSLLLPCTAVVDSIWAPSQINFMPGTAFAQAWGQYWLTNKLVLGTPINRAFDKADEALQQPGLFGKTVVVVFGDGEPICLDGMPAPQRAAQWLTQGIETYVVGLSGGTAGSALLNDIAANGGTVTQLLPANYQQLEQELAQIATTTVTAAIDDCVMTLSPPPPNPDDVHLIVTEANSGQEFEVPRDPGNGQGWTLSSDGVTAEILGQVCSDAKAGRFSDVRFIYGCVDVPVLK